jgi:5'-nucleotidase
MGTPFGAATREIGGELQLMALMGYDATTFGNHEFDLGPDGLGKSIGVAAKAGRVPALLSANANMATNDNTLVDLQRLSKEGVIRPYLVIERGGIRFGIFGVLGKEAIIYTSSGAVTFADAIESTVQEVSRGVRGAEDELREEGWYFQEC